jgi:hypothetical protein
MGELFNRFSFYLSFVSIGFVILLSLNSINDRFMNWFGIHPLEILFYFCVAVFLLGIVGFSGAKNWKGALRSIFTVGFTLVMVIFLGYIIFVGNLAN